MISIIVPVYNAAKYLDKCINSIICQTHQNWELILVNDGSKDESEKIIGRYTEKDSRIKLFSKENGGVSRARNLGIENASGEYLFFLDSDDWLSEDACEILLKNMLENKADCVICGFNQTSGNIWAPPFDRVYNNIEGLQKDFDFWLNTELLSSSVNKLYKKHLIKSMFPIDVSYGEDLIFSLNYLKECQTICFIPNPLYQHEVYNTSSLTHSFKVNKFREVELIQTNILKFATNVTSETYRKYVSDVLGIVKSLFRQQDLDAQYKFKVLKEWYFNCYFKAVDLKKLQLSFGTYLYAKFIKAGCWKLLNALHWGNNMLKKLR